MRFPPPTLLVVGFQYRDDAEEFQSALRERFAKFSLELHPDKTRLIEFGRYAVPGRKARGQGKPETFSFLGSRTSARSPGGDGSGYGGSPTGNGCGQS